MSGLDLWRRRIGLLEGLAQATGFNWDQSTSCKCIKLLCVYVTYIHDAVFFRVEKKPVIKESQLGIGGSHI